MHSFARVVAGALAFSTTTAVYTGFNYGNTHSDGSAKQQSDFEAEFRTAKNLVGAPSFTSARLFTSVQGGTAQEPISAFQAAIAQDTSLLLGIWASAGPQVVDNEITAVKAAINQFGDSFTSRVAGISVGSEDLYRDSVIGIQNDSGIGAGPDIIAAYIDKVRSALSGTMLGSAPIGHVDTWTAWVNGSSQPVIQSCDFIGFDAYPYFQNTMPNSIENSKALFQDALSQTRAAVGDKPIWVTETGWPVSGPIENQAVPSLENAETYWEKVGCGLLFGKVNTWWYTLRDAEPVTPSPSFGVVGSQLSTTPLYDLSCKAVPSSNRTTTGTTKPAGGVATSQARSSATASRAPSGSKPPQGIGGAGGGRGRSTFASSGAIPTGSVTSASRPQFSHSAGMGTVSIPSVSSSLGGVGGGIGGIGSNAPGPTNASSVTRRPGGGGIGGIGGVGSSAPGPTNASSVTRRPGGGGIGGVGGVGGVGSSAPGPTNASSATRRPGGGIGGIGGNTPGATSASSATRRPGGGIGGIGGNTPGATSAPSGSAGTGVVPGGAGSPVPSGSTSLPSAPSGPMATGMASAATVPTMHLVGAIAALVVFV